MKKLGKRLLYCDTDSIIFVAKPEDELPALGKFLGDFTDEVDEGCWIDEFVSSGPKNYAYKLNTNKTTCKIKGFTLNYQASNILNMDAIKNVVINDHNQQYTVSNETFVRNKENWTILSKNLSKIYGFVYDKRNIKEDYFTYPFGF